MSETADVVVVGAGHNSLVTAAYLAHAGLNVIVLEKNAWVGGGAVTLELTAPGFKHDQHSTGHQFIMANPMITNDEIGLQKKFGLKYLIPKLFFSSIFPDQTLIKSYIDLDKTCESFAKLSVHDAEAYRSFVKESNQILPLMMAGSFVPPAPMASMMSFLGQTQIGQDFLANMNRSCYDIIDGLFENEKIKLHFLRFASEVMMSPETKGTGAVFYLQCVMGHKYGVGVPQGGSGELSASLVRCIQAHGGKVITEAHVKSAILANGRATGVTLDDGRRFTARKVVVASVHPWLLSEFVNGAIDEGLKGRLKRVQTSDYSAVNTHYALKEPIKYKINDPELPTSFAVETLVDTLTEFRQQFDEIKYGRMPKHLGSPAITNSVIDPTRAPPGKQTLYLYTFAPFDLADGGSARWDDYKEEVADRMLEGLQQSTTNLTRDNIIARHVDSPLDFVRHSPSFQRGDLLGVGSFLYQFMGQRPIPELAQYAVPGIDALYLSGPFMHPSGGIIGGGRATAIKIMTDLKMNTDHLA